MSDLTVLSYPLKLSGHAVALAVDEHGNPWFDAKEVCAALSIPWSGVGDTLRAIPKRWKGMAFSDPHRIADDIVFINFAALHNLAFSAGAAREDKIASVIISEVLPKVHRHGSFRTKFC